MTVLGMICTECYSEVDVDVDVDVEIERISK